MHFEQGKEGEGVRDKAGGSCSCGWGSSVGFVLSEKL